MSISTYFNGSYIMSFLKVMTLILVHLEEFQNKHALIRISLADKVKLIEDSKKHGFDKFTASDENDVAEVFCSDCDEIICSLCQKSIKKTLWLSSFVTLSDLIPNMCF